MKRFREMFSDKFRFGGVVVSRNLANTMMPGDGILVSFLCGRSVDNVVKVQLQNVIDAHVEGCRKCGGVLKSEGRVDHSIGFSWTTPQSSTLDDPDASDELLELLDPFREAMETLGKVAISALENYATPAILEATPVKGLEAVEFRRLVTCPECEKERLVELDSPECGHEGTEREPAF